MKLSYIYILICLLIVAVSWEEQRSVSASVITETREIPEEAIRLRVLANSDLPGDQWLKREVRDQVVEQITTWVEELASTTEAREEIEANLSEIENIVGETININGYDYTYDVQFGEITFPTKLYGSQLYPAGEYEGVLITIGAGQGENWWCVLFPPLCFVDFGTGEVIDPDQEAQEGNEQSEKLDEEEQQGEDLEDEIVDEEELEVKFFIVELVEKVRSFFA